MFKNKYFMLFIMFCLLFLTVSAVNAVEDNNDDKLNVDDVNAKSYLGDDWDEDDDWDDDEDDLIPSKIVAKPKTFKAKIKTKIYTIKLKANKKPVKKVKVTLKIKGKKFYARTNKKGQAIFKIKKLTKKGKYNAKIMFKGNNIYDGSSKKVKIRIK